ncbi:hypothetical protein DNTS_015161 [Danionella cerebrum]|uniref:NADH dehydrogenase [ubiquinone] 1 alpha subcomplex subunit 11 n=1 Tax=Danionella cerebrum TaxID=2873325 RepID=A0A553RGY4_9TELE|nr:hypothetical protein DNTS_015161 [Danionella translucida]
MPGYWELEEGKDCVAKTVESTKFATFIGLSITGLRVVVFLAEPPLIALKTAASITGTTGGSRTNKVIPASLDTVLLERNSRRSLVCFQWRTAMGAIFGLTTCLSAQMREKPDSALNYFIGGCASGALLGVRTHSILTGSMSCFALGCTAALAKIAKIEDWRITGTAIRDGTETASIDPELVCVRSIILQESDSAVPDISVNLPTISSTLS